MSTSKEAWDAAADNSADNSTDGAQGVVRERSAIPSGIYTVEKFHTEADVLNNKPYEVLSGHNAYVNAGGVALLNLLVGAGGTPFNNGNAYIGVGDSATAVIATQTDLVAAVNKFRKGMDAGFPSLAGQVMTWRVSFGSNEANFAWQEAGLFNGAAPGAGVVMLSRIVQNLGTKAGGIWQLSYTITLP